MNLATFSGGLGRDAERGTAGNNNTPFLKFPLGTSIGYGERKRTLWILVTLWGRRSESKLFDLLGKGTKVVVSGDVDLDIYKKSNQETGASITLKASEIEVFDSKPNGNATVQQQPAAQPASQNAQASAQAAVNAEDWDDDDVPF